MKSTTNKAALLLVCIAVTFSVCSSPKVVEHVQILPPNNSSPISDNATTTLSVTENRRSDRNIASGSPVIVSHVAPR